MSSVQLERYRRMHRLSGGDPEVLLLAQVVFDTLLDKLIATPMRATPKDSLVYFEEAILQINLFEEQIETAERETILAALYEVAAIVGLSALGQFAEQWRGDW